MALGHSAVLRTSELSVQRAPTVEGEFVDPTPAEGQVLEATGKPLQSPAFQPTARFDLVADNPDSSFGNGEYRQYIKGAFRQGGVAQPYALKAGPMSEDKWTEDAKRQAGSRYGYRFRSQGVFTDDEGNEDRKNGRHYQSWDQPSASEEDDEMDLHFRGTLVDTGDDRRVIAERHWHVYGKVRTD